MQFSAGNFRRCFVTLLLTGGYSFIGSAVVRHLLATTGETIVNLDKMTYAANPAALAMHAGNPRHVHVQADICDPEAVRAAFATHRPTQVMHLAAESHVDRSIDGPAEFIQTNIVGTQVLLEAARAHWLMLDAPAREAFRVHHVSTDEVFGSLYPGDAPFTPETPYDPRSPYSASKAASDHLVRAWRHTYGMPTFVSNITNNYGPWQFPEKLIPLVTLNALEGKPRQERTNLEVLPVYGEGGNIRDWLHVEDHAEALVLALFRGVPGATYCIGPVQAICATLYRLRPDPTGPRERGRAELRQDHAGRGRHTAGTARGGGPGRQPDLGAGPGRRHHHRVAADAGNGVARRIRGRLPRDGAGQHLLARLRGGDLRGGTGVWRAVARGAWHLHGGRPTKAVRPANSRLEGARLGAVFGARLPGWREGLARVLRRLLDAA